MWKFSFIANIKTTGRFHQITLAFIENLHFEITHFDFIFFYFQVSFSTNYYGKNHFDAIVTVNLTAMLVLATLFITINAELPTSSTIKWIDIWMLFALSFPFMEVILHTAMEWMVQKKSGLENGIRRSQKMEMKTKPKRHQVEGEKAWSKKNAQLDDDSILR